MTVSIPKSQDEIKQLPLVELAYELLKTNKEPIYFRDIMDAIRELRGMTEDEAFEVIARLYTEINIDGRFIHLGQNFWGLRRWFPVEKANERPQSSKRFVRGSGDAFSDDDELDDYDEEDDSAESGSSDDEDDSDDDAEFDSADDSDDDDYDDSDEESEDSEDFDGDEEEDVDEVDDEFADETEEEAYPDDELDDANPDDEDEEH